MRIALLSTCAVSVPPKAYGGTELVTAELAKMLARRGHDVTVYATGDSTPEGELCWRFARPVWPPDDLAELRHAAFAWGDIARRSLDPDRAFDVVHAHQAPSVSFSTVHPQVNVVLTLHHKRVESLLQYYVDFPEVTYVAISKRQAELVPELGPIDVVHHGVDLDLYPAGDGAGGWAAFVGRLAPEKAPQLAIDAAIAAGVPLKIGGQAHWPDRDFFAEQVKPRLDRAPAGAVEWLGEVSHAPKLELLRGARALLFPLEWEEPFGLVMIEAMLVGTPVIAFPRGSVREVVEDGVTGYVVKNADEMAARLRDIGSFDRARCRARAQARFSSMRMAEEYEAIYERVLAQRSELAPARVA